MVFDPEKADLEASQPTSHEDGPEHLSDDSMVKDEDSKKEDTDGDSIHSDIEPTVEISEPKSKSRASSVRSRALSVVPRSKRRGLLGRLSLIPEVNRPYDYANKTKWTITLIVALAAAAAPLGSAIFFRKL